MLPLKEVLFCYTCRMAILIFQHHRAEPTCRLGETLQDIGHRLRTVALYEGESLPSDLDDVDGVISMGGPMNVDQADAFPWIEGEMALIKQAHEAKLPVVGICLGAQLVAKALGGEVGPMEQAEVGFGPLRLAFPGTTDPIYAGIPWSTTTFHAHAQQVTDLPPGATPLAGSPACKNQAFKVGLTTYAFQYHFEWDRADLARVLSSMTGWLTEIGADVPAIKADIDKSYPMYRHLGDRLCRTLTDLVFPLDKRLSHKLGPVQNYHASYF